MARPRVYDEPRVTTAVRIPESVHELLKAEAQAADVSVNWWVNRAIEDALDRHRPYVGDIEIWWCEIHLVSGRNNYECVLAALNRQERIGCRMVDIRGRR